MYTCVPAVVTAGFVVHQLRVCHWNTSLLIRSVQTDVNSSHSYIVTEYFLLVLLLVESVVLLQCRFLMDFYSILVIKTLWRTTPVCSMLCTWRVSCVSVAAASSSELQSMWRRTGPPPVWLHKVSESLMYCYSTLLMHPLPDRVKPSFVIFDIQALWRLALSVRAHIWKLQMMA